MRYAEAVAAAPPGSQRFRASDLARLGRSTLSLLFAPGPAAPPLEEVAAALGDEPEALHALAAALPPPRGERLLRLSQRPVAPAEREKAGQRLVRGAFWHLAYELAPDLWDRLASSEPIAPDLLAALPADGARVLDVGAGTGRLSAALESRAACLVAIEPSPPLRRLLRERLPSAHVAACGTFGPDPPTGGELVCAELERCARPGGTVALIAPESPKWWRSRGYSHSVFPAPEAQLDAEVFEFFGPPRPPRHLLLKRL